MNVTITGSKGSQLRVEGSPQKNSTEYEDHLNEAFKRVKANKGSHGVDGMGVG